MSALDYTPGYSNNAVRFMSRRTAGSHARFFLPLLRPGMNLLDCGCGPGSITRGLAEAVSPGNVVGVDAAENQVMTARAESAGVSNIRFESAQAHSLPFASTSFDAVFSHALFEHLPDPHAVAKEFFRVLKPQGVVGLRSPDWGGFLLAPPDAQVTSAIAAYRTIQNNSGGDTEVGRKLGKLLLQAGFQDVQMSAEYECYGDRELIADYLALRLETAGKSREATALRNWSRLGDGLFAQAWVSVTARRPV